MLEAVEIPPGRLRRVMYGATVTSVIGKYKARAGFKVNSDVETLLFCVELCGLNEPW